METFFNFIGYGGAVFMLILFVVGAFYILRDVDDTEE